MPTQGFQLSPRVSVTYAPAAPRALQFVDGRTLAGEWDGSAMGRGIASGEALIKPLSDAAQLLAEENLKEKQLDILKATSEGRNEWYKSRAKDLAIKDAAQQVKADQFAALTGQKLGLQDRAVSLRERQYNDKAGAGQALADRFGALTGAAPALDMQSADGTGALSLDPMAQDEQDLMDGALPEKEKPTTDTSDVQSDVERDLSPETTQTNDSSGEVPMVRTSDTRIIPGEASAPAATQAPATDANGVAAPVVALSPEQTRLVNAERAKLEGLGYKRGVNTPDTWYRLNGAKIESSVDPEVLALSKKKPEDSLAEDANSRKTFLPKDYANDLGIPLDEPNPYYGVTQKQKDKMSAGEQKVAEKILADHEKELAGANETIQNVKAFMDDNSRENNTLYNKTAGHVTWLPGVPGRDDIADMQRIANKLIPAMRQGTGISRVTNMDMQIFKGSTLNPSQPQEVNRRIAAGLQTAAEDALEKKSFLENYFVGHGNLRNADKRWQEYVDANPIFDPTKSTPSNPVINNDRPSWQDYFRGRNNGDIPEPKSLDKESRNAGVAPDIMEKGEAINSENKRYMVPVPGAKGDTVMVDSRRLFHPKTDDDRKGIPAGQLYMDPTNGKVYTATGN